MAYLRRTVPSISAFQIGWWSLLGWLLALLPIAIFAGLLSLHRPIAGGAVIQGQIPWAPSLGVALSWQIDGLSLLFALLISGVGALVLIYASGYLADDAYLGRFYLYLLGFMIAMLGLVISANLLTLFIFWELTSITSYLLIGYKHRYESARAAALQALLVTGGGGLAMMAGILLLGQVGGSLEMGALVEQRSVIQASPLYAPIVILVLLGAFTKSAQFPFHFWLPNAMAAPTPVSAYLHSATMVKAGVFLVARLTPVLGGTILWFDLLVAVGGVTMVMGAFLAWRQTDLKRILAYTTISALGTLMLLLGIGTDVAIKAAMVFLIAHALYKGALFMLAGAVEHQTGTRDITQLGGLGRLMPVTAIVTGLAALSMSGIPPLTGFVSKELFYEATLYAPAFSGLLTGAALLANVLTVVAAMLIFFRAFSGQRPSQLDSVTEAGVSLLLGPGVLASAGLAGGLLIGALGTNWVAPAVSATIGATTPVKLSLWHGFNPMLALSALTLGLAGLIWLRRSYLIRATTWLDVGETLGPEQSYSRLLAMLPRNAAALTRWLQHGYLRLYLLTVVVTVIGLVGFTLMSRVGLPALPTSGDLRLHEAGVLLLMLAAAAVAISASSRLTAIVALGVVGLGMTLVFAFYSAPDLAMTQFAVETLTVLLFVFVIYRLPRFATLTGRRERLRDAVVATLAGALMTLLALTALQSPHPMHVSEFFAAESWLSANGRNVVNVILVDFRALDTLGEIVVLMVAALGVHALVRPLLEGREQSSAEE